MSPHLMYVTDPATCRLGVVDVALAAVEGGADIVQVRGARTDREALEIASSLSEKLRGAATVLVNERIDVAAAAGADGVHLKDGGLEPRDVREVARALGIAEPVVSVACHDAAALARAGRAGADHATIGPLHGTHGRAGLGVEAVTRLLEEVSGSLPRSVLLLGGVTDADAALASALGGAGSRVGLAAIRWFQDAAALSEVTRRARRLRSGLRFPGGLA